MNTHESIERLEEALNDARADVATIESVHAEASRVTERLAELAAKASSTHDAALATQRGAERAYGDAPNEANAKALQDADRAARVASYRLSDATAEAQRAHGAVDGAHTSLRAARERVTDLEQRIRVEELRIAATPEALHERVDPLALRALELAEQLIAVHEKIGREIEASSQAAAKYSKAGGTGVAAPEASHAYLAIAEALAARGVQWEVGDLAVTMPRLLAKLLEDGGREVSSLVQAIADVGKLPIGAVSERDQRFLTRLRASQTLNQARYGHLYAERELEQQRGRDDLARRDAEAARRDAEGSRALGLARVFGAASARARRTT